MHNSLLKIQLTYARGTTYNYRAWRYCHGLRDDPYQTLLAVGLISWLLKKIGTSGWVVLGIWIFRWLSRSLDERDSNSPSVIQVFYLQVIQAYVPCMDHRCLFDEEGSCRYRSRRS